MHLPQDSNLTRWRTIQVGARSSLVIGLSLCILLSALIGQVIAKPLLFAVPVVATYVLIAGVVWFAGHETKVARNFGLPNLVTLFRGLMVCQLAGLLVLLWDGTPPVDNVVRLFAALSLFAILLDGLDGYLARRVGPDTAFGARFDMEIDAFLILLLALIATVSGKVGAWIILAGALRYLFVAVGWFQPWLDAPLFPSFRRKLICVVQIGGLWLLLLPEITADVGNWIAAGTLVLLIWSFAVDSLWLHAKREQRS